MKVEWKGKVRELGASKQAKPKPVPIGCLGALSPSFLYRLFFIYQKVFKVRLSSPQDEGFRVFLRATGLFS